MIVKETMTRSGETPAENCNDIGDNFGLLTSHCVGRGITTGSFALTIPSDTLEWILSKTHLKPFMSSQNT